jgi:hypothetical protein
MPQANSAWISILMLVSELCRPADSTESARHSSKGVNVAAAVDQRLEAARLQGRVELISVT